MTGAHKEHNGRCPLCGGRLVPDQRATVPFILENTVIVIKDVPAEMCASCHEPFMTGKVTDRVTDLLKSEVSVVSYSPIPIVA
jgi:YgiT-type zinc finger domain-containing protein